MPPLLRSSFPKGTAKLRVFAADLEDLTDSIGKELARSPGIIVVDCRLISEDDFSFSDIKRSIEWDIWDDLSYRE